MTRTAQLNVHHTMHEGWNQWVTRHGFEPRDVLLPNHVTADDDAHTVTVERCLVRDETGSVQRIPGMYGPVIEPKTVQLEAPALPFPDETQG